jgi:hypothetical protein
MSFMDPADTVADRHEKRRQAARKRWPEIPAGDLEARAGYIVDRASGALFTVVHHVVFAAGCEPDNEGRDVAGFYNTGTDLVFLKRAQSPGTVEELEQREQAKEQARLEREQAHNRFLRDQPKRTLRLCDLDSDWATPTLRAAAKLLLDHGCTLEARDGHLHVQIPEQLDPNGSLHAEALRNVTRAARVLDAAGAVVLDELGRKSSKRVDERLPDRHAGAFGGLA